MAEEFEWPAAGQGLVERPFDVLVVPGIDPDILSPQIDGNLDFKVIAEAGEKIQIPDPAEILRAEYDRVRIGLRQRGSPGAQLRKSVYLFADIPCEALMIDRIAAIYGLRIKNPGTRRRFSAFEYSACCMDVVPVRWTPAWRMSRFFKTSPSQGVRDLARQCDNRALDHALSRDFPFRGGGRIPGIRRMSRLIKHAHPLRDIRATREAERGLEIHLRMHQRRRA